MSERLRGPSWKRASTLRMLDRPGCRLLAAILMLSLSCTKSFATRGVATKRNTSAPKSTLAPPAPVPTGGTPIQVTAEHDAYTAHAGQCAVDVNVPKVHGIADPILSKRINERLREAALGDIPAECDGGRDATPARPNSLCADLPDRGKTDVVVTHRIGLSQDDLLSVRMDSMVCLNPSLHPAERRQGLTMDLRTAQVVPLEHLFAPNSHWRQRLAAKIERELQQKKLHVESPGSVPTQYYLSQQELILLGVLSAHAFASLEISIPFSELNDIVAKDGVLRNLARSTTNPPSYRN
jgi:hypothetical protein